MVEEAYKKMKVWNLALWIVAGFIAYSLFSLFISHKLDEVTLNNLAAVSMHLVAFIWLLWQKTKQKTTFKQLLGLKNRVKLTRQYWLKILGVLILSTAAGFFTAILIGLFFPEFYQFIEDLDELKSFYTLSDTPYPIFNTILSIGSLVLLAPIIEEFIFRGVMINRFTSKWNTVTAIIGSSFLFALVHIEPLGSFIFGVLMSLVYIKTGSLVIPMIIHGLNNLVAVIISLPIFTTGDFTELPTRSEQIGTLIFLGAIILILLPVLVKLWKDTLSLSDS